MIIFDKFHKYISKLEKNISKKSFRNRLLFECLFDEKFGEEVISYLNYLEGDITSEYLEKVLQEIRDKTVYNFEMAKQRKGRESLDCCMRSLAYFYFLECIDEYSLFSDNLIQKIKSKYVDNYIQVISSADKTFISKEMQDKTESRLDGELENDGLIRQYLVLKSWQDKQHYFFEGDYWNYISDVHEKYLNILTLSPFKLEQEALKQRLFEDLIQEKVIDVDSVASLTKVLPKEDIVKLVGGKMYGLAILYSNFVKIPYSVVIPTNVNVTQDDIYFLKDKFKLFSVRSSADIEDGENHSFAGMFDSFLNVDFTELIDKINMVKESINSSRVKEYIKLNQLPMPNMAVVIQSFEEPSYAGVWIANSMCEGMLEWVEGNGEKLVFGSEIPHSEYVKNSTYEDEFIRINGEFVAKHLLDIQAKLGCCADFEWMVLNGELVLLQFRPVTCVVNSIYDKAQKTNDVDCRFCGTAASTGIVTARPQYLKSPSESITFGNILLARVTDPDWIPNLLKASGAVTSRGGFLCHTAIICRELGIPCITAVGDETLDMLSNESLIQIDGNTGVITIK